MKKLMLICAPVTSRSGYGDHARDLVLGLLDNDNFKVEIIDVPWGKTPRNALNKNNKSDQKIFKHIAGPNNPLTQKQPDVYIDIRIPNEFQTFGKFNIGITAGIETNAVSQKWLECCNKMDLIIVPSEHSKQGFINSRYDKLQQLPNGENKKVGEMKLEKPIEVLFEGANEEIFKPLKNDEIDSEFFDWLNNEVPEKFAFLHVGLWGQGAIGEDRKNISKLIQVFCQSFANKKRQPALILKTNHATFSVLDREDCLKKIKDIKDSFPVEWKLPNIYLLHGDLLPNEMNYLYNHPKVKAMVSFTHGEGFGRPLLESTISDLPVIATGWSGQLDFLNTDESLLLGGELVKVPESQVWQDIIIPESSWLEVNESHAYNAFNQLFLDYDTYKKYAKKLGNKNRNKFTLTKMKSELNLLVNKYTENLSTQVNLNLPKLQLKEVEEAV